MHTETLDPKTQRVGDFKECATPRNPPSKQD